jgi:hypothetical protein
MAGPDKVAFERGLRYSTRSGQLKRANFVKKLFLLGVLIAASILVLLEGFDGDVRTEERSTSCAVP